MISSAATTTAHRAPLMAQEPPALHAVPQADAAVAPNTSAATSRSISCVIPCFNEAGNLRHLLPLLEDILWATRMRWEIIVVDDGSTDDTVAVAQAWCQLPGFRCISLSRNFGKEAALTAGLAAASGDAVVLLDGDLQHAPSLIHTMVAQWVAGAEVVYAVRRERTDESRFKQIGSSLFYKLVNSSDRFRPRRTSTRSSPPPLMPAIPRRCRCLRPASTP